MRKLWEDQNESKQDLLIDKFYQVKLSSLFLQLIYMFNSITIKVPLGTFFEGESLQSWWGILEEVKFDR